MILVGSNSSGSSPADGISCMLASIGVGHDQLFLCLPMAASIQFDFSGLE